MPAPFTDIVRLFSEPNAIDLSSVVHEQVDFVSVKKAHINALNRWIAAHSCPYKIEKVVMYHGTAARHDVLNMGLQRTNAKTKRSLQSATGFVYLSLYPDMAKRFAEMAYPGEAVAVYAVTVYLRDLLPDHDQLKNKRLWGDFPVGTIGTSVADSLVHGSGARVKKDLAPWQVRDITPLLVP